MGPMVEIEREKVSRRRASLRTVRPSPPRRAISSPCGWLYPLNTRRYRERGSRSVFVPPRGRERIPGSATMLDCPLNICLSLTKVASTNDSHRALSERKIHGGSRRERETVSLPFPSSLLFFLSLSLWRILPHARRTIGRSEINGSVYPAH